MGLGAGTLSIVLAIVLADRGKSAFEVGATLGIAMGAAGAGYTTAARRAPALGSAAFAISDPRKREEDLVADSGQPRALPPRIEADSPSELSQ